MAVEAALKIKHKWLIKNASGHLGHRVQVQAIYNGTRAAFMAIFNPLLTKSNKYENKMFLHVLGLFKLRKERKNGTL